MELRHLRYFVAVAEEENVSRAALKLHVSQPALSRQIRDLEEELGLLLLERSAKSVRLTEAGRTFQKEAHTILESVEKAVKTARAIASGEGSEIHVGYAMSPTVRILPTILRSFQSALPNVRVKLHDLSTEEMLSGLHKGKLNVAILVRSNPTMLRGLCSEELTRMGMCLAVAPNHPFARRRSVTVAELADYPLIVFSRSEYPDYHDLLEVLLSTTKLRPRMEEHDSISSLITAIEAGSGVALVSESLSCVAGGRLKFIQISPSPEPLVIAAAWPEGALSAATKQFLDCARIASAEGDSA